jgi:hypothetical protein
MVSPYIEQGNICIVPILRHHLTFAIQVQQTVRHLGLDHRDLIAVALPESARKPVLEAIGRLPRVSLVITAMSDSDQREVFPVTPADGIVEAVRTALERNLSLRFIDQEVAPGHLLDHFCLNDEEWPDDGLTLRLGAAAYLRLISGRLAHPPSRFEPIDGWRELHMAAQLQEAAGTYRRVLFVCNATHVEPVQRLLRRPVLIATSVSSTTQRLANYRISEPSVPVLMRYLDHIPRLVESYERQRAAGAGHSFDKLSALLQILHELSTEATDLNLSIRHYQVFSQILTALLESDRRISPKFDTTLAALDHCFPQVFRERAFRHLLGYFNQVKVWRIGRLRGTTRPVFQVGASEPRDVRIIYVARSCTYIDHSYEFIAASEGHSSPDEADEVLDRAPDMSPGDVIELDPPPMPRLPRGGRGDEGSETWPLADAFDNEMRRKTHTLAHLPSTRQVKSMAFSGSIQNGVDFRRTLRSYYRSLPQLYVKQEISRRKPVVDLDEPVMFAFDGYEDIVISSAGHSMSTFQGEFAGSDERVAKLITLDNHPASSVFEDTRGRSVKVMRHVVGARLSFFDWEYGQPPKDIADRLGGDINRRVPLSSDIDDSHKLCSELSARYRLNLTLSRWWEVMLATALHYAKDTALLVAPQKFVIPDHISRRFAAEGKLVTRVSMAGFTRPELHRLQVYPLIEHGYPPRGNNMAPEHLAFLVEHFGAMMKQFWT